MGIALINAYRKIDEDLVLPDVRSEVEQKLLQIAKNEADFETVKNEILTTYRKKFNIFTEKFCGATENFKGKICIIY